MNFIDKPITFTQARSLELALVIAAFVLFLWIGDRWL
jgi:hypothetical protein